MKIEKCDGAEESLEKALADAPGLDSDLQELYRDMLEELFERRARGESLSSKTLRSEDVLPDGNKFLAMRRLPIRAYFWISTKVKSTIFISHYVYKNRQKLDPKDTKLVRKNWKKYERVKK